MSKYNEAFITVAFNGQTERLDLETIDSENGMVDELWAMFTSDEEETNEEERDDFPQNLVFSDPEGFAAHLFPKKGDAFTVSGNFDELLEAWSNETDEDRREAMGEYLDDMGADDLSDFDEAYQGQFVDGAAFAEDMVNNLDTIPKDFPNWIMIDWEATWECNVRHDYHITDSGHVFRNL